MFVNSQLVSGAGDIGQILHYTEVTSIQMPKISREKGVVIALGRGVSSRFEKESQCLP